MSVNQREAILSLYLKKYKVELEKVIGMELSNIELERTSGGKKIDYYAVNIQRRLDVYVEVQITPSDTTHLEKHLKEIILSQSEGIVVWIAAQFNSKHIDAVKSLLKAHKRQKYINFYAVELNQAILPILEQLDGMYKLDIWGSLDLINLIEQPFSMFDQLEQIPKMHVGKSVTVEHYDYSRLEDVKKYVLEQLRERIPYYPNLHKAKKHNEGNRKIVLGGGRDGINYNCSVNDIRNNALVELHFSSNNRELYHRLRDDWDIIRERVHPDIVYGDRTIGVYFKPLIHLDLTIDYMADILEKMIIYFTPSTYYRKLRMN